MAARTYGQVYCSIWEDPDFIALGAGAQRTYLMLTTQDNIQACGLLPLTLRRWAKNCADKHLAVWLIELTEAGFIVLDEDTEELLVRTFTKYDGGHKHAVRRKAVISSARSIKSPLLMSTAVDEMGKLGVSIDTPEPPESLSSAAPVHSEATPAAIESQRFPVTLGDHRGEPESGNLERENPLDDVEPPSMFCPEHPKGTTASCGPCGTAKRIFNAWHDQDARRAEEQRAAARAALRDCTLCNELGFIEGRDRAPTARCDHQRTRVSA